MKGEEELQELLKVKPSSSQLDLSDDRSSVGAVARQRKRLKSRREKLIYIVWAGSVRQTQIK